MAVASPSSAEILDSKPEKPDLSTENPNPAADSVPPRSENPNPNPEPGNPNPIPNPILVTPTPLPPPPSSFAPSFRPLGVAPAPQYSTVPNPNLNYPQSYVQNPNPSMQPPGVSAHVSYMMPGVAGGAGSVTISAPPMRPMMYQPPQMVYGQPPNGYMPVPPPGITRYPGPYPTMIRPGYPPRPLPPMGVIPQIPRPTIPGVRGIFPVVPPMVRPAVPPATEKPHTTVYVGKISPTVENEYMLSILRLCGPVKSWKRAQDPTHGSLVSFGFCEFEAAEGILRALRLLPKLNIDGQELVININTNTREYLERYVEKKAEREKLKGAESQIVDKDNEGELGAEKQVPPKPEAEEITKDSENSGDNENQENQNFGIVTDEDREADKDALEKIIGMIEERLKTHPLPPPPPVQPADASAKSNSEIPSKSKDGDSDVDIMRSDAAEDKNDDETTSETRPATEHDRPETSSPERGRRHDRSSRERDRGGRDGRERDRGERDRGERDRGERDEERELKREKERNLERYERERERERIRKERERDLKIKEAERLYNNRLKEWEARERDREQQRQKEKEREKERLRERRREIMRDEDGSDDDEDDTRRRRRRSSLPEDRRRKRQREMEDDLADRLKEEEEIAEAKKMAVEEQKQIDEMKSLPIQVTEENENDVMQEDTIVECREADVVQQTYVDSSNDADDINHRNGIAEELNEVSAGVSDVKQSNDAPARKLGFGLVGSGRRATVPSVFHEEDDENVDDKKMRPLVPIDYSTEELQAVQTTVSSAPANLVAAAEFAKRISGVNPKEEKVEQERGRNGRSSDKASHRERDRNDDENIHYKNEYKEKMHDRSSEREREREDTPKSDSKNLLNAKAKQLIDMIPKTKEELFAYEINWAIYDKHELHERMRPWISKKITEFLGEEEATLVDYIVSSTKDHVRASKMLELLQSILDDEAEMFVLKMWRMLIFEIKKVETGLPVKPRA